MSTEPANAPEPNPLGGAAPTPKRNMEYLFFVGLFVLWIVLQAWVLPKGRRADQNERCVRAAVAAQHHTNDRRQPEPTG